MAEEIEELPEEEVEETIEIPEELNAIMQLAGFDGYKPQNMLMSQKRNTWMLKSNL